MKKIKRLFNVLACACIALASVHVASRLSEWKPDDSTQFVKRFQAMGFGDRTYGSGFNIKHEGKYYVITNQHVCAVSERLGHPDRAIVNGEMHKIVAIDTEHDLCALESKIEDGFELAEDAPEVLEKLVLMGHPRGLDLVIRRGRIITKGMRVCVGGYATGQRCRPSNQISALAYGGNSGSPVLNEAGEVIGVLYAGSGTYPNEPYTVPWEYIKDFVESLD